MFKLVFSVIINYCMSEEFENRSSSINLFLIGTLKFNVVLWFIIDHFHASGLQAIERIIVKPILRGPINLISNAAHLMFHWTGCILSIVTSELPQDLSSFNIRDLVVLVISKTLMFQSLEDPAF